MAEGTKVSAFTPRNAAKQPFNIEGASPTIDAFYNEKALTVAGGSPTTSSQSNKILSAEQYGLNAAQKFKVVISFQNSQTEGKKVKVTPLKNGAEQTAQIVTATDPDDFYTIETESLEFNDILALKVEFLEAEAVLKNIRFTLVNVA